MNKKGIETEKSNKLKQIGTSVKKSYLWRLVSKFLSVACSIILVILIIVGSLMFYFNMKAKSYKDRGVDYNPPFGLYTIISGSMEPSVEVYDVVIAKNTDISKIKVGDIITFISNWDINYGVTVTHRVVGISKSETGEYQLSTKGDNNGTKDGGTVTQVNLVGKVVGRIPQLGQLQFFLATKMGWFMVVFIPALAVIIYDMIKIFKLYVLKGQIDNVKTPQEASKEKAVQELKEKKKELAELNGKALNQREKNTVGKNSEAVLPKTMKKDENIDTVELPKISPDGKIIENTAEIPAFTKKDTNEETESWKEIVLPNNIEPSASDIPLIKRDSNSYENDRQDLPKRKLQRRKN